MAAGSGGHACPPAGVSGAEPPEALRDVLTAAFGLMAGAVKDHRSPLRSLGLATLGLDGAPRLRTVVLRGFDADARLCLVHTDGRSAKVAEIARDPRVALLAWDPAAMVQLRFEGVARVDPGDDAAWAATPVTSRLLYAASERPGSAVATPPPMPDDGAAGRASFFVMSIAFNRLDWLYLGAAAHRRAGFHWLNSGEFHASWLVP